MNRHQNRFACIGQAPEQLNDAEGVGAGEPRGRLVEYEDWGVGEQLHRKVDPLPLAAAHATLALVANPRLLGALQSELCDHSPDAGGDLIVGGVVRQPKPCGIPKRLPNCEIGVQNIVLRHVADPAPEQFVVGVKVEAADGNLAGSRHELAVER